MLDRCLGWQGLCVEPNPQLSFILEAVGRLTPIICYHL